MSELKVTGATFKRGQSKQNYATPPELRDAIVKRFGYPTWDLAASAENYFSPPGKYYDEAHNAFSYDWHKIGGLLWLNPPFGDIAPWAVRCHEEARQGARILLLVPASVGAAWFQNHVHDFASHIYFLSPRICFDGKGPFPKDCLLADYNSKAEFITSYYRCWRWK